MISQSGQSSSTLRSKFGRSWASYRAVLVSGRSRAIVPPPSPPPPSPPPPPSSSSSSPQATTAIARASAITTANRLQRLSFMVSSSLVFRLHGLQCRRPCTLSQAGLLQDERNGPEQLGALAELPGNDRHVLSRAWYGAEADRLPERVEQQGAGLAHAAPDHDPFGVHQIAEVRHGHPDVAAGVGDRPAAAGGAAGRPGENRLGGELLAEAAGQQAGDGRRAGVGLEAAAVAAAADVAGLVDRRVADLAGRAAGPLEQPAADHDPRADPGGELQVDDARR